jgi:hypothetical protein
MNIEQHREENKKHYYSIGAAEGLIKLICLDLTKGLTNSQVQAMREKFGTNVFPETPLDSYWKLLLDALSDST